MEATAVAHRRYRFAFIAILTLLVVPGAASAETVLITGANSGIGLEFTKQYLTRGWTVIATHRRADVPPTLAELSAKYKTLRIEKVDVTVAEQVKALASRLKGVPIDVLINNAGIYNDRGTCKPDDDLCPGDWTTQNFGRMRYELLDTILSVNVKGPLLVSETLFDNVKASKLKKIVAVSSSNGSLTGPQAGGGAIFYRSSKAALNRAMRRRIRQARRRHRRDAEPGADAYRASAVSERFQRHADDRIHGRQHDQDDRQGHARGNRKVLAVRRSAGGVVRVR
jgi:NAD(P)-dependent dehydrogenase (short-subunit alcohol dehydrogenase family)